MPPIHVVLAFLERDGQVLLTRRPPGTPLGDCWEFPGGKVEAGETPRAALIRELREEIGVTVTVGAELAATRHAYPDRTVELHLYQCTVYAGSPTPLQVAEVRWVPRDELETYEMPAANEALVSVIRRCRYPQ